jgi:hypothetical protein
MVCSREPVPFACNCTTFVLLVPSLYCKFVLLFLIYTILTFDQKKNCSSTNILIVIVSFFNCYYLTSPQIFNYIWSYRTPIQARSVWLES